MARTKSSSPPDLSSRINLTVGAIDRLVCPPGKAQVFMRDSEVPGLRVRVTAAGAKAFVFEAKLNRQTLRRTIGDVRVWSIDAARAEARRMAVLLDQGTDPRELERQQRAAEEARRTTERAAAEAALKQAESNALTVGKVWAAYLEARKPYWGTTHYNDHVKLARAGGAAARRGTRGLGKTIDMPLYPLMALPLRSLDSGTIEAWAATQAATRPTSARLAWRLLKVFLNWCAEQPQYVSLLPGRNVASTRLTKDLIGRGKVKTDALLREQLPSWFREVRSISNPVIAASLQVMLLTGARPGEVLALRWDDVDLKWRRMTIGDKVEGKRVIPLTPYVQTLLEGLGRRGPWVFASTRTVSLDPSNVRRRARRARLNGEVLPAGTVLQASETGYISEPRAPHTMACRQAGIEGLTLNGLRRSFKSLTEWQEVPVGVVAQIMGHKPSATAEKHYTVRPLDLLRLHHEKIEAWILEQGGVQTEKRYTLAG